MFAATASLVASAPAAAQSRWSAELDAAAAVPTHRLAGADLETGFGFGANVRYRFQPHLAAYGGWEWHRFRTGNVMGAVDLDVEETGYTFGLRFEHPIMGRTAGWLRAGGLGNHIELEDDDGEIISDSGHGLGWELGAGLAIPVSDRAALTPGVRYRSLQRDLDVGMQRRSGTLAYVTIGAGLAVSF
jgi:hypothetical protein